MTEAARATFTLDQSLDFQSKICRHYGCPLYADLMQRCRGDDAALAIAGDWPGDHVRDFVPLRIFGGVHQRVLTGNAPELAKHYPTAGGTPQWPHAWDPFRRVLVDERSFLRDFLRTTPQTNEIARSAALAAGFHAVALRFGLPLRIRELGASAGLNLLFDRYRFDLGGATWGSDAAAPLLAPDWTGPPPPLASDLRIESRAGCDVAPVRLQDRAARERLEAYVWAEQPDRLARLRAAIAIALRDLPRLDEMRARDWLLRELEARPPNAATVFYHSSFWVYLEADEQREIEDALEAHGRRASADQPLARLQLEGVEGLPELRLRCWPGGEEVRLLESDPHGRSIHWLGDDERSP